MGARRSVFQCEITVSSGVEEKLLRKHKIEIWEIEEVIYDDPDAFVINYKDFYFIYGQTFSGRYLLVLVRFLPKEEVQALGVDPGTNVLKLITARDMNKKQRREYVGRKRN